MAEPKHTTTTEHVPKSEEHGGFPPFQSQTFASQLIWLVIAFVLLYALMAKLALPRVTAIIENRQAKIQGDIAEAGKLRTQSEEALAAYEKALADARGRAQAIANETRDKQAAEAAASRKTLEDQLNAHPLISQCIVVGDQRPFIGALITLDREMLPTWLANRGKPELRISEASTDPDVLAELQKAVDSANAQVSKAESIRKFAVLDTDFTEASGHLTPKLSLKRAVVMKDFAGAVNELYHQHQG